MTEDDTIIAFLRESCKTKQRQIDQLLRRVAELEKEKGARIPNPDPPPPENPEAPT